MTDLTQLIDANLKQEVQLKRGDAVVTLIHPLIEREEALRALKVCIEALEKYSIPKTTYDKGDMLMNNHQYAEMILAEVRRIVGAT